MFQLNILTIVCMYIVYVLCNDIIFVIKCVYHMYLYHMYHDNVYIHVYVYIYCVRNETRQSMREDNECVAWKGFMLMGSPALAENSWKDNYRDIRNLKYQMREWISEISMFMGSPLAENSWKDQSRQLLRN